MGSRRSRRANGRTALGNSATHMKVKPFIHKSGLKQNKQATRALRKSTVLSAARAQRKEQLEEAPPLLAVFSLTDNCSDQRLGALVSTLRSCHATSTKKQTCEPFSSVIIRRFENNSQQRRSNRDVLISALDAAKVADMLVFVFDGASEMDQLAVSTIDALRSQGLPSIHAVAIGEDNDDLDLRKLRSRLLAAESLGEEHLLRPIQVNVPKENQAQDGDDDDEAMAQPKKVNKKNQKNQTNEEINQSAVRRLFAKQPHKISWRLRYGYTLVESITKQNDLISLTGWIRGRGFDANELIHITGFGSFKIDHIEDATTGEVISKRNDVVAEPIESEAPVDETMGEQTWPPEVDNNDLVNTEDSKDIGEELAKEYDAQFGDDEYQGEGGEDDDEELNDIDDRPTDEMENGTENDDGEMDMELEDMSIDADEVKRVRDLAKADMEFPDEVDTPLDQTARVRFARYRGLKSLRTGEWDPKEQLPKEYASLFQFRNLAATKKRVFAAAAKQAEEAKQHKGKTSSPQSMESSEREESCNFVPSGKKVMIRIRDVDEEKQRELERTMSKEDTPIVACGLLRHENRNSVVHFAVRRLDTAVHDDDQNQTIITGQDDDDEIIKAKTAMEIQCGFIRFTGRPMFSEHNANSDKHKMERYLTKDKLIVASFYGPAVFAPAPALLFKIDGALVASGNTLGADPDRIILKRIILTGYPFKTQKKRTVVKFMFFDREDIKWFRPVELWTKEGRSGHILEPVGTHGHMKCLFDNVVMHHDTICMTLYKRVYPKLMMSTNENEIVEV